MIVRGIVRHFGELIRKAESNIIQKMMNGRVETEPSITDRFLEEVERVFEQYGEKDGITFQARTLRGIGKGAPEKEFGADFCGVLVADLPDFKLRKGFLCQAKRDKRGANIYRGPFGVIEVSFPGGEEFDRLRQQTDDMLSVTPDSFVVVYSTSGFVVVPACSVSGLRERDKGLYAKPVDCFFKEFIMCFVGDPRLEAWDDRTLRELREETNARLAIMFSVREGEEHYEEST